MPHIVEDVQHIKLGIRHFQFLSFFYSLSYTGTTWSNYMSMQLYYKSVKMWEPGHFNWIRCELFYLLFKADPAKCPEVYGFHTLVLDEKKEALLRHKAPCLQRYIFSSYNNRNYYLKAICLQAMYCIGWMVKVLVSRWQIDSYAFPLYRHPFIQGTLYSNT